MNFIPYLVGLFVLILSFFFYDEYLVQHTYYYNFLSNLKNWSFLIFAIFAALIPAFYILYKSNKTWEGIILSFLGGFSLFSLVFGIHNGGFVNFGYFIYLLNFLILFIFFIIIIVGSTGLGDLILQKVKFKEAVYNYSIKTGVGISVLGIILYFLVILGLINIVFSYGVLILLIGIIFYRKDYLKKLFSELLISCEKFSLDIKNVNVSLKYIFLAIFTLVFLYIYFGFTYTFIPYPSAWDANHAYMFYPKVFAEYGGYPWTTDFRPDLSLWSAILTWIYNLGFFTWFSQDTWMITFNFTSGIFSLFFGFMLITTIVKLIYDRKNLKHYILLSVGYILIIAWLSSGMGAFLVFVDNKTDLAVLMFIMLGLFLAVYSLFRQKEDYEEGKKEDDTYIFFALSGFFFAIANIIKPTATFDFFETSIVFSILNIGVLAVIGGLLFVIGLLYYLKFRGFDKLFNGLSTNISKFLGSGSMMVGFLLGILSLALKIRENKAKVISFFIFIFSFIGTVAIIKSSFGIAQYLYDDNIDKNVGKIAVSYIMSNKLPTIKKEQFTGSLYAGLKEGTGSTYNEDNGRYVGYGNRNFYNPWWSFIVPFSFKKEYTIYFNKEDYDKANGEKIYAFSGDKISKQLINKYTIKIFNNKDNYLYENQIKAVVNNAEKSGNLTVLAKQLGLDVANKPLWKLRKEVLAKLEENTQKHLLQQIKSELLKGNVDLQTYPKVLQTDSNKRLFDLLKHKKENYTVISIPYKYLVPFNVTFNWSLQNLSSYYTDIGIVWLLLFIITILAFIYSFFIKDKVLGVFAFATLIGWFIWYGIASGIVWYNIGGIIWLIITTVIFVNRLKDKLFLAYVLIFISFIGIGLNLLRIVTQGGGQVQLWYKSSVGKVQDYKMEKGKIVYTDYLKIPYTANDIFSLQFNFYKKAIKYFDNRKKGDAGIIGGTYMRYFIKNQDKIINDQFLTYLYKLFSDDNVKKAYERLKDQKITGIVIDPNIASVVMGEGNKSLWYRYYGYTDEKGNITKKGVLPMFVDLAQSGEVQYAYSNNLGIKYALTIPDETIIKVLGIKNKKDILQLRYKLTSIKFLPKMIGLSVYNQAIDAFYKLLLYRALQESDKFLEDVAEANGLNIDDPKKLLNNFNNFNSWTKDEKLAFLIFNNILTSLEQDSSKAQKILTPLISQTLGGRAQLLFVKIR